MQERERELVKKSPREAGNSLSLLLFRALCCFLIADLAAPVVREKLCTTEVWPKVARQQSLVVQNIHWPLEFASFFRDILNEPVCLFVCLCVWENWLIARSKANSPTGILSRPKRRALRLFSFFLTDFGLSFRLRSSLRLVLEAKEQRLAGD